MPRLACLVVPLFPLAARLRSEPSLKQEAAAVLEGNGNAARVLAATRRARRGGVLPGMSLPQARALIPKLLTRGRDALCEGAARASLLEVAAGFSPRVEDAAEGVVFLEIDGLERHFPGPSPEHDLGHALTVAAGKAQLPVWVGIASSKLAARVAAEQPGSPTLIPDGSEAAFLAPLPLVRLSPAAEVVVSLRRWGIRSVGDLARLPANDVASRLGESGRELHQKARGIDPHPLVPHQPPPVFTEGLELEWPLVSIEPFLFVARAALERLGRRLEGRGLACVRLELALDLEPDGCHRRRLELPAPTREVKTLLTLLRLDLEKTPPGAPVCGFTLTAEPDRPVEAQLSLFGPAALSPGRLATTLARLFALLGSGRFGAPRPVDGHRPERSALVAYAPPPPPEVRPEPRRGHGLLQVRVLRPPLPIEVIADAGPPGDGPNGGGRPRELQQQAREDTARRPAIRGRVRVAAGPWNLEEGWWETENVERDYWDVELAGGGIYRIFRDRGSGEWFADGIYD